MKHFDDRVAAVTGAASGIGRELAVALAGHGCHLAISDVNEAGLAETAALAQRAGAVRVTTQRLDVADREAVFAWADAVAAEHGQVNLIFNNAGVGLGATVEHMAIADFEWLMGINFWGVVHGTQAFLPHLRATGDGHVINISSLFGLLSVPSQSAYNAAKFAVRGFTESLRQELDMLDCGVSSTTVHPGGIKTAISRNARMDRSLRDLGMDEETAGRDFEKNFITSADKAARIILRAVRRDRRRVLVGPDAVLLDKVQRLFPTLYQRLTPVLMARDRKERAA
ncbi:SDR family NAD(P)-dependent oxidoreductase [Algiphilus sp.]|uniref:SDR family NAD(P)-dependent oxidoreductase n=1 Tax=Algiphilus sp. TaxID=1872431 RepID=UPI0025BC182A|nr:SDR family oxidoreductase [Algiphilus sp.]MCK5769134.1 SDR family oxidoreductase [Algiphilus sp.]